MNFHRLITCNDVTEAYILKTFLEYNGVGTFLTNEHFTSLMPIYNNMLGAGIQLMVGKKDIEKSRKLILETFAVSESSNCNECNSELLSFGLGRKRKKKLFWIVFSFIIGGVAFNNINNIFYCKNCKTEFSNY
jgi:hypothetical protein